MSSANAFDLINLYYTTLNLKKEKNVNTVEKGENAGNQHFLLFLKCLLPVQ